MLTVLFVDSILQDTQQDHFCVAFACVQGFGLMCDFLFLFILCNDLQMAKDLQLKNCWAGKVKWELRIWRIRADHDLSIFRYKIVLGKTCYFSYVNLFLLHKFPSHSQIRTTVKKSSVTESMEMCG